MVGWAIGEKHHCYRQRSAIMRTRLRMASQKIDMANYINTFCDGSFYRVWHENRASFVPNSLILPKFPEIFSPDRQSQLGWPWRENRGRTRPHNASCLASVR